MPVKVTFMYEPGEPDADDRTGMSENEYNELTDALMQIGADNIEIEKP